MSVCLYISYGGQLQNLLKHIQNHSSHSMAKMDGAEEEEDEVVYGLAGSSDRLPACLAAMLGQQ